MNFRLYVGVRECVCVCLLSSAARSAVCALRCVRFYCAG